MLQAILAALCIAGLLLVSELAWKKAKIKDEVARKFVHITTGSFIAFLPFWVDYDWIKVLAIGFVVGNIVNRRTNWFHAIHAVPRKSLGDVLFGLGVFAVAWFEPASWLFTASILQVSLADGLAAVTGVTYGKKHGQYFLFGQPKSVIGTLTFLCVSLIITAVTFFAHSYFVEPLSLWPALLMLPLLLACAENLAVYGTDNVVLPLITLWALSLF